MVSVIDQCGKKANKEVFGCFVCSRVGLNPDLVRIFFFMIVILRVESQNLFEFRVDSVSHESILDITGILVVRFG